MNLKQKETINSALKLLPRMLRLFSSNTDGLFSNLFLGAANLKRDQLLREGFI